MVIIEAQTVHDPQIDSETGCYKAEALQLPPWKPESLSSIGIGWLFNSLRDLHCCIRAMVYVGVKPYIYRCRHTHSIPRRGHIYSQLPNNNKAGLIQRFEPANFVCQLWFPSSGHQLTMNLAFRGRIVHKCHEPEITL